MPLEQQRPLFRRVLQWSVGKVAAAHCSIKSNQQVLALLRKGDVRKTGNILAVARAREAVAKSVKGQCVAVPRPPSGTYGVRRKALGSADMEWHINAPSNRRPPWAHHPRMEQLLGDSSETGILLVPLHVGMRHPRLEPCPSCERQEEVTTRYKCPCHRSKWWEGLAGSGSATETTPGGTAAHDQRGPPVTHA